MRRFPMLVAVLAITLWSSQRLCRGEEIQFVEDFVLADDRAQALEQLVPGTDVYYFFQCIHLQNQQDYDEVDRLLQVWQQRHGESSALRQIRNRQMLLTYATHPQRTLDHLIQQLRPNLNHQRDQLESKPQLPASLDPTLISHETLKARALRQHQGLKGFEDRALNGVRAAELNPLRRRELLSRIQRPTHPDLVELILADLDYKESRGFGSLTIHRQLLLEQLDELRTRRPTLENETAFVHTYLQKLQPSADVDWQQDAAAMEAYLQRLWSFVRNLNAAHNSLKAHVLYHWLVLNESQGIYDKQRFLDYLALPRPTHYIAPRLMENAEARRFPVDLGLNPGHVTHLPPIADDEALVRRYFLHFFQTENSFGSYEPFVKPDYLRQLFAEAKITHGLGDPATWYSMLPPAEYQVLKDRVDLDFAPTNPKLFAADAPVQLDLYVKNVEKLIVKVYEINTKNYYQQHAREVNTDIELDGLVANHEMTHGYEVAPEIRMRRHFEFPQLNQAGVYVIDFIGNGKSSRAVIRKGQLHHVVRTTAGGHLFTVFNDSLERLRDVTLWMSGQQFESQADGTIAVPFSSNPGRQPIVLSHGNLSSLHFFEHHGDNYALKVAAHIDRELLLDRQDAMVLLRPELSLDGTPVSTQLLKEVQVKIKATDLDGVNSEKAYNDVQLMEDGETPLAFLVPNRLASLQVDISAKVMGLHGKEQSLTATHLVKVNQIDETDTIEDLHLTKVGDVYVLELLGKTGEVKPHRPVRLQLRHRDFTDQVEVQLATDEQGLIQLGSLEGIRELSAQGPGTPPVHWPLRGDRRTVSQSIHAQEGEVLRVPHMHGSDLDADEVSLFELRGNSYARDVSDQVHLQEHFVELRELPAGDFSLEIDGRRQRIRVVEGHQEAGYVLGDYRRAELPPLPPLQIANIAKEGEQLHIALANASKFSRVHVFATRYVPAFDPYRQLSDVGGLQLLATLSPAAQSYYMAGRRLGDEMQYVFERAYATKYPGNMLERPSLLLNPWDIRSTETSVQQAAGGDDFDAAAEAPAPDAEARARESRPRDNELVDFSNLDFLAEPSMLWVNQQPNEDGEVTIDLKQLGPHHHFHVVAVDPLTTVIRSLALPEVTIAKRDLRLKKGLDTERHYTQQKAIVQLRKGETFVLSDITSGRFETYDSLPSVYDVYATLSGNATLEKFRFILDWPKLSTADKSTKYSEFACHELNFFLYCKDPSFFADVVHPYLANKHHKTFLDLWLLHADLSEFTEPWRYTQLNTVERILLGQRIEGEAKRAGRLIADLLDLMPRDVDRDNFWFETAIQGKALDFGALGFDKVREALDEVAPPAQMGGMGGGGLGAASKQELRLGANFKRLEDRNVEMVPRAAFAIPNEATRRKRLGDRQQLLREAEKMSRRDAGVQFFAFADAARQLYEKLEKTKEWAENNYYRLPIAVQDASLVGVNAFWNDFAQRRPDQPFFSIHWPAASNNFTEMMFALSLLDLPFQAAEHPTEFEQQQMTLTAGSDLVIFQEQIREVSAVQQDSPILITQNCFRADDRYDTVQGVRRDKFVSDEFLTHVVYGCQVVVTNPTSSPRKLELLLQIPHQSMPTKGGKATKTVTFDLPAFQTQTVDYFFYFPAAGDFAHFPAHVAQDETLVAFAEPTRLHVVERPSKVDKQSWDYVSQFASRDDVLQYLQDHNVFELSLERIAHRMQEETFFDQVTTLLANRHAYNEVLWAYGLKHNDPQRIATYLKYQDAFLAQCGATLESELVSIDPVVRRTYQHLDYKPLVNARAHQLGDRRKILNDGLYQQYHALLNVLKYQRGMSSEDRLEMTYYLLLQDRIDEAIQMFSLVERSQLASHLQYDYFAAYLDCFLEQPARARAIVAKYVNYPVPKWREAFTAVKNMLDEIDGSDTLVSDEQDRNQAQTAAAARQKNFTFSVEDKQVRIDYQNIGQLQVNYYLIDLELLFSTNPFVQKFSGQFSHIKPHQTQAVSLAGENRKHVFTLPEALHHRNVLVEVVGGGVTRSQAYFSNSLTVQMSENYGQLKVTEAQSGRPISKTYVKVYAEMQDGTTAFYKDGYTDLRGRFDYASLSTNELDFVKRFSILVLDEDRGGLVREASVPKR